MTNSPEQPTRQRRRNQQEFIVTVHPVGFADDADRNRRYALFAKSRLMINPDKARRADDKGGEQA